MGRHLITSALPYINGVKHLGNLVGSMLPADVYARFLRQRGEDVLFICATDEHGTPAELAALENGLDVATYCIQQHEIQRALADRFALSFDHFGRSSSPENRHITQHMAQRLSEGGFIDERVTRQAFSVDDDRFLPDRYIVGTCPYCAYTQARGDQCESCTRLLDPSDLIDARSAVSGSRAIEMRESRHLFLLQSKLQYEIRSWIEGKDDWPILVSSIARKWLDEGLEDRSITRDLEWGVPVDRPGFENKVFYVWFDAPNEYIGATMEWAALDSTRDWQSWWYDAEDVRYTQFMAKDNIPFHTITWPSTLLGTREPWKLPDYIKGFNWLTYYGGKFSTSQRVGVFMNDALELLPADYWRYALLSNAPESSDSSFTWETLASTVNKDLAGAYGNFVNRTLAMTTRYFGDRLPTSSPTEQAEEEVSATLATQLRTFETHVEKLQFRKATQALRGMWATGNSYLERATPWKTAEVDPGAAARTLVTATNLVRLFALVAAPFMPTTSDTVLRALGETSTNWPTTDIAAELRTLGAGTRVSVPPLLFRKVTPDQVSAWKSRFGGDQPPP